MSNVKTAICKNLNGEAVQIQCRIWKSQTGAQCLEKTLEILAEQHPELAFDGWLYNLDADKDTLNLYFLSPQVAFTTQWIESNGTISKSRITRSQINS